MSQWNIEDSAELYNLQGWGQNYFSINDAGHIQVQPRSHSAPIDLMNILNEIRKDELHPPVLLRFPDILDDRIEKIAHCFDQAAEEYGYQGKYYSVYPIKVNQQKPVVEEIVTHGKKFNIGLEAGSKPELHAVLAVNDNPEAIVICNGYKDEEFIELALLAQKMGKPVFIVVEKLNELRLIETQSKKIGIRPNIGIRIKLSSSGSGRWQDSGGDKSKFGLNAPELMDALHMAEEAGLLDCIKLIHFHLGSQITNIQKIKIGFQEVAHYYTQLYALGCKPVFVDIGGGLGVDYDGSGSKSDHSMNYSIQEYANDAVYSLKSAADQAGIPHPHIISESGRSLTAHHSLLIFNVLETAGPPRWDNTRSIPENCDQRLGELFALYNELKKAERTERNELVFVEAWHDCQRLRRDILNLFRLGILSLTERASGERLYWAVVRELSEYWDERALDPDDMPEEFFGFSELLKEKYFCNFSLFQSLPDSWAIDQLFPIMPIHRLEEEPDTWATIQDITCDSDGKINHFIGNREVQKSLKLHSFSKEEPYYIGVFLVGAYQEILGDLHNLFGDTNIAHICLRGKDSYEITRKIQGETVADVLEFVEYNARDLVRSMELWVHQSVKNGKISLDEGRMFLAIYTSGLYGYTYLE